MTLSEYLKAGGIAKYTAEEIEKANETVHAIARATGVTVEEAEGAIYGAIKNLPPPGETEIALIKKNPSLNRFQKRRLIKQIKKFQGGKQ